MSLNMSSAETCITRICMLLLCLFGNFDRSPWLLTEVRRGEKKEEALKMKYFILFVCTVAAVFKFMASNTFENFILSTRGTNGRCGLDLDVTRTRRRRYGLTPTVDCGEWVNDINDFTEKARAKRAKGLSLVYSPFDLSVGGGEKYLLEFVLVQAQRGMQTVLLTRDSNFCRDQACVMATAKALSIPLLSSDFLYLRMAVNDIVDFHTALSSSTPFSVYYAMGNGRFPEHPSLGQLGLYNCQFPFDLNAPWRPRDAMHLSSFDVIVLNSIYTERHYSEYTYAAIRYLDEHDAHYPSVQVIYPPVYSPPPDGTSTSTHTGDSAVSNSGSVSGGGASVVGLPARVRDSSTVRIAMVGRLFSGRQSKGHISALNAMALLGAAAKRDPRGRKYELHIIGAVQPGHEAYAQELRDRAEAIMRYIADKDSNSTDAIIVFHTDASRTHLGELLGSCDVCWHLTGLESGADDPASQEHFGIGVVECMLNGLFPVVTDGGGVVEVVGTVGARVGDVSALVAATLAYSYSKTESDLVALQARQFSRDRFQRAFEMLMNKGLLHYLRRRNRRVLSTRSDGLTVGRLL